jgi:lysine 6-dehydrogenase
MEITVLGAGLVGHAIVRDLVREEPCSVTVADVSERALARLEGVERVKGVRTDLRDTDRIAPLLAESDLVISAVPGFMGFETLRAVIEAGKDVVDISFFNEDPFLLDGPAKSKGVTAVIDCGVAPGLCNIIAGHVDSLLDRTERYVCYVGGLPRVRQWPYEYKAVFSPLDVLEEYTRPARFVEHGREVVRPALSEVEQLNFPGVGTLEAFNTDGVRSLRRTLKAPFMLEKTLRYPGHAGLMRVFKESGFFDTTPIEVMGQSISPMALTSRLLMDQWKLEEGEEDFTVMQVVVEGEKAGGNYRYTYDLLDGYDRETQTTSMARTTGYTCTIVAGQVAGGLFRQKGVCPPEFVGAEQSCFEKLMAEYAKRNIRLRETVDRIP